MNRQTWHLYIRPYNDDTVIAQIERSDGSETGIAARFCNDDAEAMDDMVLCAAAPELLNALIAMVRAREFGGWPINREHLDVLLQARAAIAKATGER